LQNVAPQYLRENFSDLDFSKASDRAKPFNWIDKREHQLKISTPTGSPSEATNLNLHLFVDLHVGTSIAFSRQHEVKQ